MAAAWHWKPIERSGGAVGYLNTTTFERSSELPVEAEHVRWVGQMLPVRVYDVSHPKHLCKFLVCLSRPLCRAFHSWRNMIFAVC